MSPYYKITKIDGRDWNSSTIKYQIGKEVSCKDYDGKAQTGNGLHLCNSIDKIINIINFRLPLRIFEVNILGKNFVKFEDKVKCKKLKVIRELNAHEINNLIKYPIKLESNFSAKLFFSSIGKLFSGSSAKLYNKSLAELYSGSIAELYDNSIVYYYSHTAKFIPRSETCIVLVPDKRVFTFRKSQLNKTYKIDKNLNLVSLKC